MKFIHLTDTHVIGGDRTLYGANPARRLALAVDSINTEHGDADFTVVTGDLTHWGDADAYAAFEAQIRRLSMPLVLMVGNHDAHFFWEPLHHQLTEGMPFQCLAIQISHLFKVI